MHSRTPFRADTRDGRSSLLKMAKNRSIREYVGFELQSHDPTSWLGRPEIPSPKELNGDGDDAEAEIEIPVNNITAPWQSTMDYLGGHYRLLREDAVAPLRNVISELRAETGIMEKDSQENASIYEKVHIIGFTFAITGIAARITFSLRRSGKKVPWEQSKRLISGSVVALTPAQDMFDKICHVAVVAARPLAGVQQNPPEIDIFFATPDQIALDPRQEWVMVECRDAYFEGSRHTLRALQKITSESFPLSRYLVYLEQDINSPKYLEEQPHKNLTMLYPSTPDQKDFQNIDLINNWPKTPPPVLDASQYDALRRILTKELAIIQGPPGTGKTHVSVVSLNLLLRNKHPLDPPIIVAAHTNHAVDQLLRHVSEFEPDFIRLGGRTADIENIRPRTLFEIKKLDKSSNPAAPKMPHLGRQKQLIMEMTKLLNPLTETDQPCSSEVLKKFGLITETQRNSLAKGAAEWVRVDEPDQVPGDIAMWLGRDLVTANIRTMPEDFGIEIEEVDLELEQLKEMEAESKVDDDEQVDVLRGPYVPLREPFVGRKARGVTEEMIKNALQKQDMWEIKENLRGAVYEHLVQRLKNEMVKALRNMAAQYAQTVIEARMNRWEVDATYLRKARIIGMTTTGLSKYRGLMDSLKPKIVMIEEAAETLEGFVTAACFDSLEHLILVGDHQQLRGHCNVKELEGQPWNLDVSMFERLVQNNTGHSQMIKQRRMIPEIRRALKPIYKSLEDHESVLNQPPVSGMGGINTFFFSHDWPESTDILKSKINEDEANMIVGFFDYLVLNGIETKAITVLTFYNGQRKLILKKLKSHPNLQGCYLKVVTVDSYQGEENDVVLLSLVRNNTKEQIGFLSIGNRVCVALSRARRGFYLFGNSQLLCFANSLWWDVIQVIGGDPNRVGYSLPICCEQHKQIVHVTEPEQFLKLSGGCETPCREELPCGHTCALTCHPFSHELVNCKHQCTRKLECGHECQEVCYLPCRCACVKKRDEKAPRTPSPAKTAPAPTTSPPLQNGPRQMTPEGQAFRDFANGGHVKSDADLAALAAAEALNQMQLAQADQEMASALFGSDAVPATRDGEKQKVMLVRSSSHPDGTRRGIWKGTYDGMKETEVLKEPQPQPPSLLD